jgi:hypothetical protein
MIIDSAYARPLAVWQPQVEMPFVRRRIHQCYAWSCSGKNGSRRDK